MCIIEKLIEHAIYCIPFPLTQQPAVKVNTNIDDAGTFLTMTVAEKREWVR
jgi:hypothetical protein